jgi:uncharacterized paraquat-inducible protein A
MEREYAVIPVKQQYLIAFAIVALIAVMVIFAMFDFFSDQSRYAQSLAMQQQGFSSLPPRFMGMNANVQGNSQCFACGWRGRCMANGRCPNCYFMANPPVGGGAEPLEMRNANFLWFQPQPKRPSSGTCALYCPQCNFGMNSNYPVSSNSIRCPRCPAYLASSGQPAPGAAAAGQQVPWSANCPIR